MTVTFGQIVYRPVFGVVIGRWAKRLGRDGVALGPMAGSTSIVLRATILAIIGKNKSPESCAAQLNNARKKAFDLRSQSLGLVLENGTGTVVYKWLEKQNKSVI
jgi:hypothetical protein